METIAGLVGSATIGYEATRAGSVVGIGVQIDVTAEGGAGTIDVEVFVGGSAVFSVQITTTGVAVYTASAVQGVGIDAVAAGDPVTVRVAFGGFTGTVDNVVAHVELAVSL